MVQESADGGDLVVAAAEDVVNAQSSGGPADDTNVLLSDKAFAKASIKKSHKRFNAHAEHVPSDENDLIISSINALDLGWKADTCKLQKHHA